ncbi:ribose 5-phosphate isomerase A [Peribacillus deserti]|uniref:Ribose-5-phosphate isomerase A n=1 Tax=Peribacillus deserti TaxID=673318 RepID=A0ABS2QE46_9BACI|nr:ribose-5-phosphate isomerase RpiA [Peribacillus deserti]MBM7691255.1 ribose 5-phosphate isomerase A [Peribacillus deserti]
MESKRLAGEKAAEFVKDGMVVGLGTGSTVYYTIMKLAERMKQGLVFKGVPTSVETEKIAARLGIPLISKGEINKIDLGIDGADAIDPDFVLIKGGGGALLREKIVAEAADQFIVVADPGKFVPNLADVEIPVEVIPFASELTEKHLKSLGCHTKLRVNNNTAFITDNGNYILDCKFEEIKNPKELETQILRIPGVAENGLFTDMANKIITLNALGEVVILAK